MENQKHHILVTGAAGFIGAALVKRLLMEGNAVVGVDNLNSYYNVGLKRDRLDEIRNNVYNPNAKWTFLEKDISNNDLGNIFKEY